MIKKPNIILINCDDLGYGDLGCYGSKRNKTPALDRMAEEGTRLESFYVASPVCSPSRGALMTGCYPPRIGFAEFDRGWVLFPGDSVGLNEAEETLPGMLRKAGYRTSMVGKWHCGDQPEFLPTKRGFDSWYGLPYSNDMGRQVGGREDGPPLPLIEDETIIQEQPDQTSLTERYLERSLRFIRESAGEASPFFLYFAHMYVHLPLYVPKRFLDESENGSYGGAVACIDWVTDVLLSELKRLGIDEETLVIFTSDNGSKAGQYGGSNLPLRGTKGQTWEGGMRVPCIMRQPGVIPAGRCLDGVVTAMDLLPTLAEMVDQPLASAGPIDGETLWAELSGTASPERLWKRPFYYYWNRYLDAVRLGKWKLHVYKHKEGGARKELYDLERDIGETMDLSGQHPEVVRELEALAEKARHELGDRATGIDGSAIRPPARCNNPRPLTEFDPEHPYFVAMYDLNEIG